MMATVMTVRGPVAAEAIGPADAHNHLWIEPVAGAADDAPVLMGEETIAAELRAFREAGGSAIVDCQPAGAGRNGAVLARLSEASGVHVIASTGFHRRRYYGEAAPLWAQTAEEAADNFLAEIGEGLAETRGSERPVRPGLIKIAAEASLAESPQHLFEAAAAAARASGYAIEMHTEKGAAAERFLTFFEEEGVPAERLVFCHMDKRPDLALHLELVQAGVMLEYDTFYRPKYEPERYLWPLIKGMVAAGYGDRLALATDMADRLLWHGFGGQPGLAGFLTAIRPQLARLGFDEQIIRQLLGGNIISRLAVPPKE